MLNDPGADPAPTTSSHDPVDTTPRYTRPKMPTGPRWNGTKPTITPMRSRAIAKKRAWERAQELGLTEGFWTEADVERALYSGDLASAGLSVDLGMTEPARRAFAQLPADGELHWVLLHALATALVVFGARGIVATHAQLAKLLGKARITERRTMAALLELELVTLVTPTHELHACGASSERANAYRLGPAVVRVVHRGIARAHASLLIDSAPGVARNEQPSGTVHTCASGSASDSASGESASSPLGSRLTPEPAAPAAESASPTRLSAASPPVVPDLSAAANESGRAVGPVSRQGETRSVSGSASQGVGGDETPAEVRAMLQAWLAKGGAA